MLIALLLLVAGCQPLPQPFAHNGDVDKQLLALPDYPGVIVLPVSDAPDPTAAILAEAVAAKLRDANVPASTSGGNKHSMFLQGRVEDDGLTAQIVWELFGPNGDVIDGRVQPLNGTPMVAWQAADASLMEKLGSGIGPEIAGMVQVAAPIERVGLQIAVPMVAGAPGDGDSSLATAIRQQLVGAGVKVLPPAPDLAGLQGRVSVIPADPGFEEVRIDWVFLGPDGRESGVVAQANRVPTGSLDGAWGGVAQLVAEAAVPAIVELLDASTTGAGESVYRR